MHSTGEGGKVREHKTSLHVIARVVRNEGVLGLYNGYVFVYSCLHNVHSVSILAFASTELLASDDVSFCYCSPSLPSSLHLSLLLRLSSASHCVAPPHIHVFVHEVCLQVSYFRPHTPPQDLVCTSHSLTTFQGEMLTRSL